MEFTPRNIVKFVAKSYVHSFTASVVEEQIVERTDHEEDDFIVQTTSHIAGWFVSERLKPVTDRMVDKAADWIVARKNAKKTETE
jgi:hypothetical protein